MSEQPKNQKPQAGVATDDCSIIRLVVSLDNEACKKVYEDLTHSNALMALEYIPVGLHKRALLRYVGGADERARRDVFGRIMALRQQQAAESQSAVSEKNTDAVKDADEDDEPKPGPSSAGNAFKFL